MVVSNKHKVNIRAAIIAVLIIALVVGIFTYRPWEAQARGVVKVAELPTYLAKPTCALANNGCIYLFGGAYGANTSNKVSTILKFDPSTYTVTQVGDMGDTFAGGWAVNVNGLIYVGGGYYGSQPTSKIFIFNPSDNSLTSITPPASMNVYQTSSNSGPNVGALYNSGYIYEFFGYRLGSVTETVKKYRVSDNTCTTQDLDPYFSRYNFASYGGKAYITGYRSSDGTQGLYCYNTQSGSWNKEIDFYYWDGIAQEFSSSGLLFMVGGLDINSSPYSLTSDIKVYDPVTKALLYANSMPFPISHSGICRAANGKIYVFGGNTSTSWGTTLTKNIYELDPDVLTAPPGTFTLSGTHSNGKVNLSWTVSDGAVNYTVQRSQDGSSWTDLATKTTRTHTDNVNALSGYYYRVKASNAFGDTYSNTVYVLVDLVPALSGSVINANNATLSWTSVSGATSYVLERSTDGVNFSFVTETTQLTYEDQGLQPGTYYYRVKAKNTSVESSYSNLVQLVVVPPPPPPVLTGTIQENKNAVLSWTQASGATSYIVEKSTDGINFTHLIEATQLTYTDTNLQPGTYYYRVRAKNQGGISEPSNTVNLTVIPPPATPTGLNVSAISYSSVLLSWNANTEPDLAGYIIYRNGVEVARVGAGQTSYTDTGLNPDTTYSYQVSAYNTSGIEGNKSNTATIKTPKPPAPAEVTISNVSFTGAHASWTPVSGADSYNIYLDGVPVYNTTSTEYDIYGLNPGTSHLFEVRTVINGVESDPFSVEFSTLREAELTATYDENGNIVINWDAGDENFSSGDYVLFRMTTADNKWYPIWDIPNIGHFTYVDKHAVPPLNYRYAIKMRGSLSNWYEWTTISETDWATGDRPLRAPGGIRIISIGTGSAVIAWNAVEGATYYLVSTSPDGTTWGTPVQCLGTECTVPRSCYVRVKAGSNPRSAWSGTLKVN